MVGVAPVLYFPSAAAPNLPRQQQIVKNTNVAIEYIRHVKGSTPPPYTRKYTQTIEDIEKEVDMLVGGAEKLRKPIQDHQAMDRLTLMERCLRHGIWSYHKARGCTDWAAMDKWLVYTANDGIHLSNLKLANDLKNAAQEERKRRMSRNEPEACLPVLDWEKEYATAFDREIVVEKRLRYATLASHTTSRDEAEVAKFVYSYRESEQNKRLDDLVELLEKFKPILAREAIMQRLAVKHLEGQLAIHRYLDWNPDVRDRAEVEADNACLPWEYANEEKRFASVRLRSKNEISALMAATQAQALASKAQEQTAAVRSGKANSIQQARDKLLQEILQLQARVTKGAIAEVGEKKVEAKHEEGGWHKRAKWKMAKMGGSG